MNKMEDLEQILDKHPFVKKSVVKTDPDTGRVIAIVCPEIVPISKIGYLTDELCIHYNNKSEVDLVIDEIFNHNVYLRNGIEVNDGDVIVDVGANIGMFSLYLKSIGMQPSIYACEPIANTYALLNKNLADNGITNCKTYNIGIGEKNAEVYFDYYENVSVLSGRYGDLAEEKAAVMSYLYQIDDPDKIKPDHLDFLLKTRLKSTKQLVQLRTLSDLIASENIPTIDLLKVDAEKSEMEILQGITDDCFGQIRQAVVEVHDINDNVKKIDELLKSKGFYTLVEQDNILKDSCIYNIYASKENNLALEQETSVSKMDYELLTFEKMLDRHMAAHDCETAIDNCIIVDQLPLDASGNIDESGILKLLEEDVLEL